MRKVVLLDSGLLGMVANPNADSGNKRCYDWMIDLRRKGTLVKVPEIADYEVRRGLLLAGATTGINRLDEIIELLTLVPITSEVMRKAAELWAQARRSGTQTAHDHALDGDMILSAQALVEAESGDAMVVATTNVSHLGLFVTAKLWEDIQP